MSDPTQDSLSREDAKVFAAAAPGNGAAPPPAPDITAGWPMHARQLSELLTEIAGARRRATVAYAEAYLAAEGTQQARAATAELAAAASREVLEHLEGLAEAFRMVMRAEANTDAISAALNAFRPGRGKR